MSGSMKKTVSVEIQSNHAYAQFMEDSNWIVVATNDKEKPLQLFSYNGSPVGSVGKGEVVNYSTVGYDSGRKWLISNKGNNILMFDRQGRLADFDCINSFDRLSGISYHPSTGLYLLTDVEYHCVLLYDPRSKRVVRTIGSYGKNAENFKCPSLVCCDKHGGSSLLCVADRRNNQAKLFNIDGQLVEVFGPRQGGEADGELSHPLGMCMDAKRRVIVCDQLNKRVVRYNSAQAADDQYATTSPALEKFKATLRGAGDDEAEKAAEEEEEQDVSDLVSEISNADSTTLFERCPESASEYRFEMEMKKQRSREPNLPRAPSVDELSDATSVGGDLGEMGSGNEYWDCIIPAEALAARVTDLGAFGTRYTSSVDLNSKGMLALTLYEDCDEKLTYLNLYTGYH